MGVTQGLRALYPGLLKPECAEAGCSFDGETETPRGVAEVAILKGEEVAPPGRKAADCLVFVELDSRMELLVFVVELKSGTFSVTDVRRKLANSRGDANEALARLDRHGTIRPVLVYGKKDPQAIKALATTRIGNQMILLAHRRMTLAEALESA